MVGLLLSWMHCSKMLLVPSSHLHENSITLILLYKTSPGESLLTVLRLFDDSSPINMMPKYDKCGKVYYSQRRERARFNGYAAKITKMTTSPVVSMSEAFEMAKKGEKSVREKTNEADWEK
uniref:Uncharacterized protein n=1 Tax=Lygus hesperus TaxID=30085 RepID=A0A146M026_LYGHE